jgi:hypothetical protein
MEAFPRHGGLTPVLLAMEGWLGCWFLEGSHPRAHPSLVTWLKALRGMLLSLSARLLESLRLTLWLRRLLGRFFRRARISRSLRGSSKGVRP